VGYKIRENRCFRRYRKKISAKLFFGKGTHDAEIFDYSLDGLGALVKNPILITSGDLLNVVSEDLHLNGKYEVEWVSRTQTGQRLGLHKLIPLSGSLENYRLADILIGLQRTLKTGTLKITSGETEKNVYFRKGSIIFAGSNRMDDKLGYLLLREGRISQSAFDLTSKLIEKTGKKRGALLVEIKAMTPEDLTWAVKHQVEEILLDLFQLCSGTFVFHEDLLPAEEVIHLKLTSGHLIYQGLKRSTCREQLKDFMDLPAESVIAFSKNPLDLFQEIPFDEDDRTILSLIDGKRTIGEIQSHSGLGELYLRECLSILMNTGIIQPASEKAEKGSITFEYISSKTEPPPGLVEKIEQMHREFPALNYYAVLGVDESATEDELRAAFYLRAKEYHPDRHYYLDEDMKEKLHKIFSFMMKAYNVLSSPERRIEYDSASPERKSDVSRPAMAEAKFEKGRTLYADKQLDEASKCFEEAIFMDKSVAKYYFFYGRVLWDLQRLKDAERAMSKACKIAPHNDEYHTHLGNLYLSLGLPMRAKMSFIKALEFNRANKEAKDGLLSVG